MKIVAAPDVALANKDLRKGVAATSLGDHFRAQRWILACHDFGEPSALARQQTRRTDAKGAARLCIHHDLRHRLTFDCRSYKIVIYARRAVAQRAQA